MNQEDFLDSYLSDYNEEIIEYSKNKKDIVSQGVLLWNILYSVVLKYQVKYDEQWYFVKHEDLSLNPMVEFEKLFSFLDLEFNESTKSYILKTTTATNNSLLERNSKENIQNWKQRLADKEIEDVKKQTHDVWSKFYTEEDW